METPKTLSIKLITHIPGYQKISYTPSMTIPGEKSEIVRFNPLIKLKESVIKDEPADEIQKQFFQKHLFNTLNNKILSSGYGEKEVNLEEATKKGYIANNVNLTIKTLFPNNGIIYISGKPYTIYDVDFDNKAWAMQPKEVVEESLQPREWLKNRLVQQQNMKGIKELETIPKEVKEGPKYVSVKTIPDYSPDTSPAEPKQVDEILSKKVVEPKTLSLKPPKPPRPQKDSTAIVDPRYQTPLRTTTSVTTPPPLIRQVEKGKSKCLTDINKLTPFPKIDLSLPKYITIPEPNTNWEQRPVIRGTVWAQRIRDYFKQNSYFTMLDTMQMQNEKDGEMFSLSPEYIQTGGGKQTRKMKGGVTTKNKTRRPKPDGRIVFNRPNYNNLLNKLQVIPVPMDGDCFFTTIAQGINMYNKNATADKKISACVTLGGRKIEYENTQFTSKIIRWFLWVYLYTNPDKLHELLSHVETVIIPSMTDQYHEKAENIVSTDMLNSIIKNVYSDSSAQMFIQKTRDYNTPFELIHGEKEIFEHIMASSTWAEQSTIPIIEDIFKIKLLILKDTGKKDNQYELGGENMDFTYSDNINKYMFLHMVNNNHYDLIVFSDKIKGNNTNKKVIFDLPPPYKVEYFDNISNIPPVYILFFLFGWSNYYVKQSEEDKKQLEKEFSYILPLFNLFRNMINSIIKNDNEPDTFIQNYDNYFPSIKEVFPSPKKGGTIMNHKRTKRKHKSSNGRKTRRCSRGGGPQKDALDKTRKELSTASIKQRSSEGTVKSRTDTLNKKTTEFHDAEEKYNQATTAESKETDNSKMESLRRRTNIALRTKDNAQKNLATAQIRHDEILDTHAKNEQKVQQAQEEADKLRPLADAEAKEEKEASDKKSADAAKARADAKKKAEEEAKKNTEEAKKNEEEMKKNEEFSKMMTEKIAKKKADEEAKKNMEEAKKNKIVAEDDNKAEEDDKCPVCLGKLDDNCITTECKNADGTSSNHRFDKDCIKTECENAYKEKRKPICPLSRKDISETCKKLGVEIATPDEDNDDEDNDDEDNDDEDNDDDDDDETPADATPIARTTPTNPKSLFVTTPDGVSNAPNRPSRRSRVSPYSIYAPQVSESKDNLSYRITLHLTLEPGTKIPFYKKPNIACHAKWDKIKQDWAKVTNTQYAPAPNLPNPSAPSITTKSKKITKGGNRRKKKKNKTRRKKHR